MKPIIHLLLKFLEQQSKGALWAMTLFAAVAVGGLDNLTGFEISFSFFYLLPVSVAAWAIGRTAGLGVSIACAIIWLAANLLAGERFSSPIIPYWNAVMRAGFFVVATLLLAEVRQLLEHERSLARTDFLTGVLNRRAFYLLADLEIVRAGRYLHPFTVLYIDLDNFKAINDQMGHHTGDHLLQFVAQSISHTIRSIDAVARLGGDEFAVLLPETNEEEAKALARRLQSILSAEMSNNNWPVTFSIGALTCCKAPLNSQELIRLADQLMYSVKTTSKDAISYLVYAD